MNVVTHILWWLSFAALVATQSLRWLRVTQREHYVPGSTSRFALRWLLPTPGQPRTWARRFFTSSNSLAVFLIVLALGGRAGATWSPTPLALGLLCFFPVGLSIRGRTGSLAWTRRLVTLSIVMASALVLVTAVGFVTPAGYLVGTAAALLVPLWCDLAALVTRPFEDRLAAGFITLATKRLARVQPRVVAITGSYGKTSTKHHLADLLVSRGGVVPSPKSFNNRAGLSRAINENLHDGTEVFIAEMGTYGPGEIAELCAWCPPSIAIVTAIGPVHLERMKSMDVIDGAKFEITERADVVILNVDDERLAAWVPRLRAANKRVVTVGQREDAVLRLIETNGSWTILRDGVEVATVTPEPSVRVSNLALALAAAYEVGLTNEETPAAVARCHAVPNRLHVATAPSGVVVLDDTFNANPASAQSALDALCAVPGASRRVVVTPGMVEMGSAQFTANATFARAVRDAGAELIVVARTNRVALTTGYGAGVRVVDRRDQAVAWVRAEAKAGDAVLYLNDLPDHYP